MHSGVLGGGGLGRDFCISRWCLLALVFCWFGVVLRNHTEVQAGPDMRTTAMAARPVAVESAYIVESPSSMNLVGRVDENARACPDFRQGPGDSEKKP